jgi:hypothetical protein
VITEDDYRPAVDAVARALHGRPGIVIAIDGRPGSGKSTFGYYLAYRFRLSMIETDLFLVGQQGPLVHRRDEITRIIAEQVDIYSRPVIVEGAAVLRLLSGLGREPAFTIYVSNKDAPELEEDLEADLVSYEAEFSPPEHADLTLELRHFS